MGKFRKHARNSLWEPSPRLARTTVTTSVRSSVDGRPHGRLRGMSTGTPVRTNLWTTVRMSVRTTIRTCVGTSSKITLNKGLYFCYFSVTPFLEAASGTRNKMNIVFSKKVLYPSAGALVWCIFLEKRLPILCMKLFLFSRSV